MKKARTADGTGHRRRAETVPGDRGKTSDPLSLFCASLQRLQRTCGIKQAALLGAAGLKRSQVSDILNGKIDRWRESRN